MIMPTDLRLRILVAFGVVLLQSPVSHVAPSLAYLGLMVAMVLLTGTPVAWRRLLHLEAFLILIVITLPLTIPGEPMLQMGWLTASWEGVERALVVALKVSASLLLLTVCFAHVEPVRIGQALRGLMVPEALVRIFLGLIRYLSIIKNEFTRMHDAMRMRSFRPRSNLHTWKTYGNMIGMLLLRAMARADRVDEAMRVRGYAGQFPTPTLPSIPVADWLASSFLLVSGLALLYWDIVWFR